MLIESKLLKKAIYLHSLFLSEAQLSLEPHILSSTLRQTIIFLYHSLFFMYFTSEDPSRNHRPCVLPYSKRSWSESKGGRGITVAFYLYLLVSFNYFNRTWCMSFNENYLEVNAISKHQRELKNELKGKLFINH